ncbi:hypothetical protein [Yinghuangia soli]|uniref:Uncharacterized protein n=1 Tax=Yinghuangia soli TaxID=2908204 RepID=A0AA41PUJ8_9ACTN|nr:hypothetical protein [Yinghuangia soli]MCF2526008.1 hypothetical protein [Yinghuangia soli]
MTDHPRAGGAAGTPDGTGLDVVVAGGRRTLTDDEIHLLRTMAALAGLRAPRPADTYAAGV